MHEVHLPRSNCALFSRSALQAFYAFSWGYFPRSGWRIATSGAHFILCFFLAVSWPTEQAFMLLLVLFSAQRLEDCAPPGTHFILCSCVAVSWITGSYSGLCASTGPCVGLAHRYRSYQPPRNYVPLGRRAACRAHFTFPHELQAA